MQNLQCAVVGDSGVGKTGILLTYCTHIFPTEHVPTVFDNYTHNSIVNQKPIHLVLQDTPGDDDLKNLRILCYNGTDVCIICFSVIDIVSFTNVELKWIPELKMYCPNAMIVLVGTKIDLRCSFEINNKKILTFQDGLILKNKYCLDLYVECSSLSNNNIQFLMHSIISTYVGKKHKICSIL